MEENSKTHLECWRIPTQKKYTAQYLYSQVLFFPPRRWIATKHLQFRFDGEKWAGNDFLSQPFKFTPLYKYKIYFAAAKTFYRSRSLHPITELWISDLHAEKKLTNIFVRPTLIKNTQHFHVVDCIKFSSTVANGWRGGWISCKSKHFCSSLWLR